MYSRNFGHYEQIEKLLVHKFRAMATKKPCRNKSFLKEKVIKNWKKPVDK